MENAFFRFYRDNDPKKVFSTIFIFVITFGGILSTLLYFASGVFGNHAENFEKMMHYSAIVLFFDVVTLIPFALLRMERKTKQFAGLKLLMVLIAVILNIYFIVGQDMTGEAVFLAQVIASGLGIIFIAHIIKRYFIFSIDWKLLKQLLAFGLPTVPAALSTLLLKTGDHFILPIMKNPETLAIYSTNYKLALPMMMFVTTFDYAFKPLYMNMFKDSDAKDFFARVLTYFVLLSCIIFLIISLFMPYFVQIPLSNKHLINSIYWEGLSIIPLILGGYFFLGLFNYFALGINITKNTKILPFAVGIAMIINIVGNIILIPIYSYTASAWLTLIAYIVSAAILYFKSQKVYELNYNWAKIIPLIVITLAVYVLFKTLNFGFFFDLLSIPAFILILLLTKTISISDFKSIKNLIKKSGKK